MSGPLKTPKPADMTKSPELKPETNLSDLAALIAAGKVEDLSEDPRDNWHEDLRSADEIMSTDWPEPVWAIPGLLPVGLTFLAGAAKQGKSMLGLQILYAVGSGGEIFGERVPKGSGLYLALEDPERRLKSRMLLQGWVPGLQVDFLTIGSFTDRLGDLRVGGAERLGAWIKKVGYRLVVIDTLSRAIQGDHNDNREMTEWLSPLQEMAHEQGCAILVIDHHRKRSGFDPDAIGDILGSTAKGAMADTVWGLYRERGKIGARLFITGRDVSERTLHILMDWDTGTWQLDDEGGLTTQQQEVLETVAALGNPTNAEIAKALDRNRGTVHNQLEVLVKQGLVTRQGKRWQLTSKSSQVVTRVPETTDNTDNIHNISCH